MNDEAWKVLKTLKEGDQIQIVKVKGRWAGDAVARDLPSLSLTIGSPRYKTEKDSIPANLNPNDSPIYTIVEENPQFPEGQAAMFKWLVNNLKYPKDARENGVQGTVYVGFVVEKDGSITNVSIKRGIGGGCDEEAARVIASMLIWKAGRNKGEIVRTAYTLPIKFQLEGGDKVKDATKAVTTETVVPDNTLYTIVEEKSTVCGRSRFDVSLARA